MYRIDVDVQNKEQIVFYEIACKVSVFFLSLQTFSRKSEIKQIRTPNYYGKRQRIGPWSGI